MWWKKASSNHSGTPGPGHHTNHPSQSSPGSSSSSSTHPPANKPSIAARLSLAPLIMPVAVSFPWRRLRRLASHHHSNQPPSYEASQAAAVRTAVDGAVRLARLAFPDLLAPAAAATPGSCGGREGGAAGLDVIWEEEREAWASVSRSAKDSADSAKKTGEKDAQWGAEEEEDDDDENDALLHAVLWHLALAPTAVDGVGLLVRARGYMGDGGALAYVSGAARARARDVLERVAPGDAVRERASGRESDGKVSAAVTSDEKAEREKERRAKEEEEDEKRWRGEWEGTDRGEDLVTGHDDEKHREKQKEANGDVEREHEDADPPPPFASEPTAAEPTAATTQAATTTASTSPPVAPGITEEALLLVLCARVLQAYYEAQGHRDARGRRKTRLAELRACGAPGCGCFDYDDRDGPAAAAAPAGGLHWCFCLHTRGQHHGDDDGDEDDLASVPGDAAAWARALRGLLLRHVNWDPLMSYAQLRHRQPSGARKTYLGEVAPCLAQGCRCVDFDLDRSRAGGGGRGDRGDDDGRDDVFSSSPRGPEKEKVEPHGETGEEAWCRCGHGNVSHGRYLPDREERERQRKDGTYTGAVGKWDGAWILVEEACMMLNEVWEELACGLK